MSCRRSIVLMMLLACSAPVARASSSHEAMSVVTIRIHDYSTVDGQQLQHAEQQVSRIYERIGVRLDWRPAIRPAELASGVGWPEDRSEITIVVLAGDMTGRVPLTGDVAGYAPISRKEGGRVAFVLGQRIREIAAHGHVPQSDVLAGVISHELAHLLMPDRSHSPDGVMRAHWKPSEFRHFEREGFSRAEASSIRRMAESLGGARARSRVAD